MAFSNRWITADGILNEQPITIRFRDNIEAERESGEYPQCVQIAWNAEHVEEESGYPDVDEMAKIDTFNQRLMACIEPDAHGLLVMVLTSQGVNQWIIYCRDLDEIQTDLNGITVEDGTYPIEVVAEDDSDWNNFIELRSAIKTH